MFYVELFRALADHKVRYVLVGGLALNLHGVERATMDIDLAIALDPVNLAAALDAAEQLLLVPVAPVALRDAGNPATLEKWRTEKNMIAFGLRPQRRFYHDLIAMKKSAGHALDLADIEALESLKRLGLTR